MIWNHIAAQFPTYSVGESIKLCIPFNEFNQQMDAHLFSTSFVNIDPFFLVEI